MATTARGIFSPDSGDGYDLTVDLAAMADTIDDALDAVDADVTTAEGDIVTLQGDMTTAQGDITDLEAITQIKHFQPANTAALNALTGMGAGDKALQTDTQVLYRYSGAAWAIWESAWTAYTPTYTNLTVGTGGNARSLWNWRYVGGRVEVEYEVVLGTSGFAVGTSPKATLPVNRIAIGNAYGFLPGYGQLIDANTNAIFAQACVMENTSVSQFRFSYYNGPVIDITATAPFTWQASDGIRGQFTYTPA